MQQQQTGSQSEEMKGSLSTGKRLFQYGLLYKKTILLALLLLIIAVVAEVIGPLIARQLIDNHIMGVKHNWYYVADKSEQAVPYGDKWLVREDRLSLEDEIVGKVKVDQSGLTFYIEQLEPVQAEAVSLSKEELLRLYDPEIPAIIKLAVLYFGLLIVAALFAYGQRLLLQTAANHIVQKLRNDVFAHTQRLPVQYYDHLSPGQIVSRVTNDTEAIRELFVGVIANFSTGIIYITTIYGAIFLMSPKLGLLTLPLIPALALWIYIYRKFAAKYNRILRAKLSEINANINESIQGMSIIQAFRKEKKMEAEFDEHNQYYFKYQNKMLSLNSLTSHNLLNVLRNIIYVIVIVLFWQDQLGAGITVGVIYAYIDYMNRMFHPLA